MSAETSARSSARLTLLPDDRALEAEAIPAYEKALALALPRDEEMRGWTWLASSYSKTGRHAAALSAIASAESLGGYERSDEFERIARAVKRRSRRRAYQQEPGAMARELPAADSEAALLHRDVCGLQLGPAYVW